MDIVEERVEDVKRLDEIVRKASEEGFNFLLDALDLDNRLPIAKRILPETDDTPPPERLRELLEELGPSFIKFGQILAERPDLIPEEYAAELKELEESVESFSPEKAREILEKELGPVEENFSEFQEDPIGSASIAQVHRAELKNGKEVAVKIRRPGIKQEVERDLDILQFFADRADEQFQGLNDFNVSRNVREFARWTREELDLKKEARNARIFRENMKDDEDIRIPYVYSEMSTEKVMVMEYVEGVECDDEEGLREMDVEGDRIADTMARSSIKQIIRDGFFHADPHPSNFLIDGEGRLIYLDFGMMGKLTPEQRKRIGLLIVHAANEDVESVTGLLEEIGSLEDDADRGLIKEKVEEKILVLRDATLEEESFTQNIFELLVFASRHGLRIPSSYILMLKTMVTMEGVAMDLHPGLQMKDTYAREIKKVLYEQHSPEKMADRFAIDLLENEDLVTELPSKLDELTEKKKTEVRVVNENSRSMNQTVTAALLISSGILMAPVVPDRYLFLLGALEIAAALMVFWFYR